MGRKRAGYKNYSIETICAAINGSAGIISTVAKKLNCDWVTAEKYALMYPETRQALKNEREKILDVAESSLFRSVQNGEAWGVKTLLFTKGKERGYVSRSEYIDKSDDLKNMSDDELNEEFKKIRKNKTNPADEGKKKA